MNEGVLEVVRSAIGTYEVYEQYVVVRYDEGCNVDHDEAAFIRALFNDKFDSGYGFISDKINSFSSNPIAFKSLFDELSSLKCIAWVTHGDSRKTIIPHLVSAIIPGRIKDKNFDSLSEAVTWILDDNI